MLESELFLSRGLKLHTCHTLPNANCDRCLIAPGGGSGIPAVYWGGERGGIKSFLGIVWKEVWAREGQRPNLICCCSPFPFPSPSLFFPFFFFSLPLFVRFIASISSNRSILGDKEQVFLKWFPSLCISSGSRAVWW